MPSIKHLLILVEEEPPGGKEGVLLNVLENAYYERGRLYDECVAYGQTKMVVVVTGKEKFSEAFIFASAKTQFPEIDVKKIRYQKFDMKLGGRKRSGVIISD